MANVDKQQKIPATPRNYKEVKSLTHPNLKYFCKAANIDTKNIGRDALEIILCDTMATPPKPFESLADLVDNGRYKLGAPNGTQKQDAWKLVQKDKDNIVTNIPQMLNRIMLHDYAGITDGYLVDYITSTNCSFQSVADAFPRRICTIAFQKHSPFVAAFSSV
ncbi:hypothetical protein GQR58_016704 [Nymphon striatum]|nr:hypothetical protein GQR58_016704 [Nymphon striatum]